MDRFPPADLPLATTRVRGADAVAATLLSLGCGPVFAYPGGANLELMDALARAGLQLVRSEHEQGAVFAAQGWARATGQVGVVLATSGPGATNLVTGIADACSDSVPILAITGNVPTPLLGRNAFQEVDIVAVTRPITRLARQLRDPQTLAADLAGAWATAAGPRPGPVLLDVPKDVQQALIEPPAREPASAQPMAASQARHFDAAARADLAAWLRGARRPVIYAGGGVIAAGMSALLQEYAEVLGCPVTTTLMGKGVMPAGHPLFLGPLGMHGAWCANVAVNEADLVLALGVRFDDRVTGRTDRFAEHARIVHIDVDATALNKNKPVALAIQADLANVLPGLLQDAAPLDCYAWRSELARHAEAYPLAPPPLLTGLTGASAIAALGRKLPANHIVTTGVGQHQMWAMQHIPTPGPRRFLSSSGFGTMGFGLPAAIGAKLARPDALVVDIDGDGSLAMTVNELATCRRHRVGVKVVVINNQWLGMVRQWQDMLYDGLRTCSDTCDPAAPGSWFPDFVQLAQGYGIAAERVTEAAALPAALDRLFADPQAPGLLDVIVRREDDVLPMIPAGGSYRDTRFA